MAIEPLSNRLVFQASHPSTIQFYSATQDIHVYEQDISPSNRVSRTDERPIEPVRVEQIAFSATASPSTASASNANAGALQLATDNRGAVWMATFDTWQDREYTRESHLKFWMGYPSHKPGYGLVSRIDNPHGQERLSSMCFAPSPSSSTSTSGGVAKLCTTSFDGTIKLWQYKALDIPKSKKNNANTNHLQGIWQCLYSLSYRSLGAVNASFSKDGSLLAIAHKGDKVALWDVESGNLVKAFNVREDDIGKIRCVAFGGLLGTRLIAGGEKGHVIWDLLTCEGEKMCQVFELLPWKNV